MRRAVHPRGEFRHRLEVHGSDRVLLEGRLGRCFVMFDKSAEMAYSRGTELPKVLVSEDELQDIGEHKGHIVSEQFRGYTRYDA